MCGDFTEIWAHPAQAPDRAIRLNKFLADFICQKLIPLLSLARGFFNW
jgi:hypothetical protein